MEDTEERGTRPSPPLKWWSGTPLRIYASHVFSSWGDRMWNFALGIYLYYVNPKSLRLTAIYGFSSCTSIILLGAVIGKCIDRMERLRAAQIALVVQNSAVILCAVVIILKLHFTHEISSILDGSLSVILIITIILLGVIADLGSVATKIAIQKDWVVVLSQGNTDLLAKMNSVMRTIDLTTSILAPILVGQILEFAGKFYGAVFIGGWNLVSVFVEYFLLASLYKQVPQLRKKIKVQDLLKEPLPKHLTEPRKSGNFQPEKQASKTELHSNASPAEPGAEVTSEDEANVKLELTDEKEVPKIEKGAVKIEEKNCWSKFVEKLNDTKKGWREYFRHFVRNAGLGLAFLYMTVLGFDNITRVYALNQGVSESYLGIFTAVGAVFGIIGSLSFPCLRKTFGELVTGNIGFGTETFCLLACLISIVTPGSPFVYYGALISNPTPKNANGTFVESSITPYTFEELCQKNVSILLLLFGIVTARFGLWIADLTVSQIHQENVVATQRGVINGVQGSLNQGMNLIKFTLVILLPNPDTFAYLIAVSWLFVFLGWILFMTFCCQVRTARARAKAVRKPSAFQSEDVTDKNNNGNVLPHDPAYANGEEVTALEEERLDQPSGPSIP